MSDSIIVFNAGSSSLKFSLFDATSGGLQFHGEVEDIPGNPGLTVYDATKAPVYEKAGLSCGHEAALSVVLKWHAEHEDTGDIVAAGHRVVHGGKDFAESVLVTEAIIEKLEKLIPLAPLHHPHNLKIINVFAALHPAVPQIACFDTAFHRTQPRTAELFALPRRYADEGVLRYGFHGLSYDYIASVLPDYADDKAQGRVVVAHLGNGASMCAMTQRKSVATTMGFTALDGLMMGTRCGALDPGVVLYLMQTQGLTAEEVTRLLYKDSGLKGVSGVSHDMRDLLASGAPAAKEAIDLFCYQAARQLAGLIPALGGLDVLVFTAGIGAGSSEIRKNICKRLSWLGLVLDDEANVAQEHTIHSPQSAVDLYVIATNEERTIADMTMTMVAAVGGQNKNAEDQRSAAS